MFQLRAAMVDIPWATVPKLKFSKLQLVLASTYTKFVFRYNVTNVIHLQKPIVKSVHLLCCPVFVPQITGGAFPWGEVTEKVSVRHSVACVTGAPFALFCSPFSNVVTVCVRVLGPLITKVLKSSRS